MPLTIINGANAMVNGGAIFSASIDEGLNLQTSGVLLGSRLKPATYQSPRKGTASITAPPASTLVASAIAQLVESPTSIGIVFQAGTAHTTLADALCTSFGIKADQNEIQISMSFEGTTVVESTGTAPTAPTGYVPLTGKDITLSGAATGCILDMDVTVSTSYDQKVCLGSDIPTGAVGALYEVKGSATIMQGLTGSIASGGDLVIDVGGAFTLTVNNVVIKRTWDISGPTGVMKKIEFTGSSDGTAASFVFA